MFKLTESIETKCLYRAIFGRKKSQSFKPRLKMNLNIPKYK